jgi:SnoaL-like domain
MQTRRLAQLRRFQEPGRLRQLRGDRGEEPTGRYEALNRCREARYAELADGGGLGITGTASGTRYGPKGFLRSSEEAHEAFENYTVTPEDFTGVRNFVLVRARLRGKGRASGISLDALVFQLWELSDGKVVRSQIFMTEAQALEAVGLSE